MEIKGSPYGRRGLEFPVTGVRNPNSPSLGLHHPVSSTTGEGLPPELIQV